MTAPDTSQPSEGAAREDADTPMNGTVRLPQSLRLRLATGVVAGALVVAGVFLLDTTAVAAVAGLVGLAGGWEWARLTGLVRPWQRLAYLVLLAVVGGALWTAGAAVVQGVLVLAALWWLGVTLWLAVGGGPAAREQVSGPRWRSLALGVLLLPAMVLGIGFVAGAAGAERGVLLYVICLVWAADVGAYFAGRAWGRRALAPRISAGKTWEGFGGGLLAVAVYALAAAWLVGVPSGMLATWTALALVAGAVSVAGDLFESLLKRAAGAKDSGTLLPGHGGVLDRIDSLVAATPILALGLAALPLEWLS